MLLSNDANHENRLLLLGDLSNMGYKGKVVSSWRFPAAQIIDGLLMGERDRLCKKGWIHG